MNGSTFIAVIVAAALSALATAAALQEYKPDGGSARSIVRYENPALAVYTDPDTGCQYIKSLGASGGFTPRMLADGKQLCLKEDAK